MTILCEPFGQTDEGQPVEIYTLTNAHGLRAKVMTYGALMTSFEAPDREGQIDEITLGFDTLKNYLPRHPYFGATVGRVANRIAHGQFTLQGKKFQLALNHDNHPNHIHGGHKGFDKVLWHAQTQTTNHEQAVTFSYLSPDGEEGYPGNLQVKVTYRLTDQNELSFDYEATTDKPTPINLTNHTYWNLNGAGSGNVHDHLLQIHADQYLDHNEHGIPLGTYHNVAQTPLDFTHPTRIGQQITQMGPGYDHCYVLRKKPQPLAPAAVLSCEATGRVMEIQTTQPGVQFYTASYLEPTKGANGRTFDQHGAVCLETQHFPDSVNQPAFPTVILQPGQTYRHTTTHHFSTTTTRKPPGSFPR